MRHTLLLLLLATGCEDFGTLQKQFCDTARLHHGKGTPAIAPVLCDDFEDSSIDASKWQMTNLLLGGTIATEPYAKVDRSGDGVDGDKNDPGYAYRGRGALHAVAPMNGTAQLIETKVTPGLGTPAIRAFVWPGLGQVVGTTVLFSLVDAQGNDIRRVSLVNGVPMLTDSASGMSIMATGQLSADSWNCINFYSLPTEMDMGINNGTSATLSGLPSQAPAAAMHIGLARSDSNPASSEMWLDEIIIDSTYIGCSP